MSHKAVSGKKTVTTAGTPVALLSTSKLVASVQIVPLSTNTGIIYVGFSDVASGTGFELQNGDAPLMLPEVDLSLVYIDASIDNQGVSFIYEGEM